MGAIFQQLSLRSDADHEDVRWALSTASALWAKGAVVDAVKWLRRAGTAATDADDDLRAVEIFKAAADMQAEIQEKREARSPAAVSLRPSPASPPPLPSAKKSSPPALPKPKKSLSPPLPSAKKLPLPSPLAQPKSSPPRSTSKSCPPRRPPRPTSHAPHTPAAAVSLRTRAPERPEEVRAMRVAVYAGTTPGEVCISPVPVGSEVPEGAIGAVLVPMDAAEMRDLRVMLERRTTH